MYGEPLCECKMQSRNLPRSAAYLADHTLERIAERNENLRKALQEKIAKAEVTK
jgi:hypothetical protein